MIFLILFSKCQISQPKTAKGVCPPACFCCLKLLVLSFKSTLFNWIHISVSTRRKGVFVTSPLKCSDPPDAFRKSSHPSENCDQRKSATDFSHQKRWTSKSSLRGREELLINSTRGRAEGGKTGREEEPDWNHGENAAGSSSFVPNLWHVSHQLSM